MIHLRNQILGSALAVVVVFASAGQLWTQDSSQPTPADENRIAALNDLELLGKLAVEFDKAGKLRGAIATANRLLKIQGKLYGVVREDNAGWIAWIAERRELLGEFDLAVRARKKVLEILIELYGEVHWKVKDARLSLANVEMLQELTSDQRAALRQAGSDNNQLLRLYRDGKFAQAIEIGQSILDTRRDLLSKHHPSYVTSLNNLGELYYFSGNYARAESLYLEAKAISEEVLGKEHPSFARSLNNLGTLYMKKGARARAEPLYLEAKEIREKVLGKSHPDYALNLCNLAVLYRMKGDYVRAEPLFLEAIVIREKVLGKGHPDYASSLISLAKLYTSLGDYARAEPLYLEAKAIDEKALGEEHPDYAMSLYYLAGLYDSMGDYARAEPLYLQAKAIREKVLGKGHPEYATSLNTLALMIQRMGDYARAEPLYLEAKAIRENVLGKEHPEYADSLNDLAMLYHRKRDYARVEPLYLEAKAINEKVFGKEHLRYADNMYGLAKFYHATGKYARAGRMYFEALKISGDHLELTSLIQSEQAQLMMAESLRYRLDNMLSLPVDSQALKEQAVERLLLWKGSVLVRQMRMRRVADDDRFAPLFERLQQSAMRLASLSRMTPAPGQQANWKAQLQTVREEKERLEKKLSRQSSEFRKALQPVTLEALLAAIPENAVLVDFLEYNRFIPAKPAVKESKDLWRRSLLACVLRPSHPVQMVDLGLIADVNTNVDAWRRGLGATIESMLAGQKLRRQLWTPLEKHLTGVDLVLLSTDGALGRLPFAALPGREDDTYLIEDYRLAMVPVAQLLPSLVSKDGRREVEGDLLVMGDVDYDADAESIASATVRRPRKFRGSSVSAVRGDQKFGVLSATAGEIATIQDLYRDLFDSDATKMYALKRAKATEALFREQAPNFHTLHLATHGFFADPSKRSALQDDANDAERQRYQLAGERDQMIRGFNPGLLSGLTFSGANRKPELDKDDGILTAEEIATLSLDGVDLVVLSACETGLGQVAGGEGLLGVQRAFQVAGARTTIASLWKVDDLATRNLMERFYRNYWDKEMSKLDALREAQLWMLRERGTRGLEEVIEDKDSPQRLSPYYWAAFTLSGDWR